MNTLVTTVTGASRSPYQFEIYRVGTVFIHRPALYIFARELPGGGYSPLYVGETSDLNNRVGAGIANHHKYDSAIAAGMTHVLVCLFPGNETSRRAVERDIITALDPPLNDKGVPGLLRSTWS